MPEVKHTKLTEDQKVVIDIANQKAKELNYNIDSLIYLRKNFKENAQSNAFLYLITQKQNYINELANLQKPDKSFGNVFETAVSILALDDGQHQTQIDQSRQWLDLQQDNKDFSWNKNVLDTSVVLYSAYSKEGISLGEQTSTTPSAESTQTNCNEDNVCDESFGENALLCPKDCSCGDKVCDSSESSSSCSEDCKEVESQNEPVEKIEEPKEEQEKRSFGFLWFILIFLVLAGLGYLVYKKFGSSLFVKQKSKERQSFILPRVEPKKTEFKGPIDLLKPIKTVRTESKSKVETDLEKSLREARKLLER